MSNLKQKQKGKVKKYRAREATDKEKKQLEYIRKNKKQILAKEKELLKKGNEALKKGDILLYNIEDKGKGKIPQFQPFKKGGKINDGNNFVARQYGGKIGK
tara:strand:- start:174 stop:476 length:303 start_codon:yes stop_codon:yes gene_type:complete